MANNTLRMPAFLKYAYALIAAACIGHFLLTGATAQQSGREFPAGAGVADGSMYVMIALAVAFAIGAVAFAVRKQQRG